MINYNYYSSILFDKWNDSHIYDLSDSFKLKNKTEMTCRIIQMAIYAFSSMRMAQMIPIIGKYRWLYGAAAILPYAFFLKRIESGEEENGKIHKAVLAIMVVNTVALTMFRSVSGVASLFSFLALPICLHKRYLNQFHSYVINFRDSQKNTLLHLVAKHNQVQIVKELVTIIQKQDRDDYLTYLSSSNEDGYKAIHLAESPKMIHFLVEHQANPNEEANNDKGYTPLMFAAKNHGLYVIDSLIQAGADLNKSNKEKETALDVALQNHHWELAKEILEKKDLLKPETIEQALDHAIHYLDWEPLKFLLTLDIKITLEHLKKAIATAELDVFYLLQTKYSLENNLLKENISEATNLFKSISYSNLFSLLNISPFIEYYIGSESNMLVKDIVKAKWEISEEELQNVYKLEQMTDLSWVCKVEVKGEVLGEGKDLNKDLAQRKATKNATKAMSNDEKYFKYFLRKMPDLTTTEPMKAFHSFLGDNLTPLSDPRDSQIGGIFYTYKEENGKTFCCFLSSYKDILVGVGIEEFLKGDEASLKAAKGKARVKSMIKFLSVLNEKIQTITLQDIRNLPPINKPKDSIGIKWRIK